MSLQTAMTSDPACATPGTPLTDVARMMVANDCGLLPVVDDLETRKLVGVVSDRDIVIRAVANQRNPLQLTAADVMTAPALSVEADAGMLECCELLEANQVRRMPVVDDGGRVCGIISLADLAQREHDHALVAEVMREVSVPR